MELRNLTPFHAPAYEAMDVRVRTFGVRWDCLGAL